MEVLIYSYYNFNFDREEFATRTETLRPGSFDFIARTYASPTQISIFRIAFHYLEFTNTPTLLIKSALIVLSLFKRMRTIVHLVENDRGVLTVHARLEAHYSSHKSFLKARRRRCLQNLFILGVFFCTGVGIFVHSMVAVVSTKQVCAPRLYCVVVSYRWHVGAEHC